MGLLQNGQMQGISRVSAEAYVSTPHKRARE